MSLFSFSRSLALSLSLFLSFSPSLALSLPHSRALSCSHALAPPLPVLVFRSPSSPLFPPLPPSSCLVLSRPTEHTPQWAPTAPGPYCCSSYATQNSTTKRPAVAGYRQVQTADTYHVHVVVYLGRIKGVYGVYGVFRGVLGVHMVFIHV